MLLVGRDNLERIAGRVRYTSVWNNGAGTLEFEYPAALAPIYDEGTEVVFTYGEEQIFYGFLFRTDTGPETRRCVCYDQLRYLRAQNSLVRGMETLSVFTERCAAYAGDRIRTGRIEKTEGCLSKRRFENRSYYDMILQSIQENEELNGYHYTLFDRFGAVELADTRNLRLPLVVGDGSLATGFSFSRGIGEDVYNSVRVVQNGGGLAVAEDAESVERWGRLVLCQQESGKNQVQLRALAESLLKSKNRLARTLQIEAVGDTRVMGGSGVKVILSAAGLSEWAVVRRAAHRFERNYTMSLELELGRFAEWNS